MKLPSQTLLFSRLKFVTPRMRCAVKEIHGRNFKKITNKAIKKVKSTFVWAFIIQHLNPNFKQR